MSEMKGRKKLLTGLIAVAAIGAVAGVVLHPKSGKKIRQLLRERTNGLGTKAGGLFGKGRSQEEAEASAASDGSARYSRS